MANWKKYAPVGLAVGAGLLFYWWSTRAKAAPRPTPMPDEDAAPPIEPPAPPGAPKVDAPAFPYSTSEARNLEKAHANTLISSWEMVMAQSGGDFDAAKQSQGIPAGRSPSSWYTDEVMGAMYPNLPETWPSESRQGKNWKPYVDSWKRTYNYFKSHSIMNRPG